MGTHNCYGKDINECVEKKTHELWKNDGCKQGRDDLDYWLRAEKAVNSKVKK